MLEKARESCHHLCLSSSSTMRAVRSKWSRKQFGCGCRVALDRGFEDQAVFGAHIARDVGYRDRQAAIAVGARRQLAAKAEQDFRLASRDERLVEGLVALLPLLVHRGRQIGALAIHARQQMMRADELCLPMFIAVLRSKAAAPRLRVAAGCAGCPTDQPMKPGHSVAAMTLQFGKTFGGEPGQRLAHRRHAGVGQVLQFAEKRSFCPGLSWPECIAARMREYASSANVRETSPIAIIG